MTIDALFGLHLSRDAVLSVDGVGGLAMLGRDWRPTTRSAWRSRTWECRCTHCKFVRTAVSVLRRQRESHPSPRRPDSSQATEKAKEVDGT